MSKNQYFYLFKTRTLSFHHIVGKNGDVETGIKIKNGYAFKDNCCEVLMQSPELTVIQMESTLCEKWLEAPTNAKLVEYGPENRVRLVIGDDGFMMSATQAVRFAKDDERRKLNLVLLPNTEVRDES